ncbi:abasic site processing protein HMCES-like [Physella acuta]|uniref:abasic site processing protein HMCES-like n=1 Tax=Physella acuta TaxID=109671 RepID=UPI0027DDEFD4|nr:abasic site processing protein HMCES-like [Physella acuta]
MCGRTACTLSPNEIVAACRFKSANGEQNCPQWMDAANGQKYYPSYNKAPTSYTPVLLSSQHFDNSEISAKSERVVLPMKWGLTPSWHKGDPYKIPYETNNCRAEGMLEKRTYKVPLQKGYRCVILADGFFEWKTLKEGKQPYFFYFMQPETVQFPFKIIPDNSASNSKSEIKEENESKPPKLQPKVETNETVSLTNLKEEKADEDIKTELTDVQQESEKSDYTNLSSKIEEWHGPKLLTMAGVFDIWKSSDGSPPLYSYSIITVSASSDMDWCHHRMPAILSTPEEVNDWLDFSNVPLNKASALIKPQKCLSHHPVSKAVNNSRNHTPDCLKPVKLGETKPNPSSNLMMSWLKTGSPAKKRKI